MEKHNLTHEFPQFQEKIALLKTENAHFKKLANEYDEANHAVHRVESGAEVTTDEHLNELRIQRVRLKDELYSILQQN
jgi:uncharacterized protein YdcH (DUF465 family)